MQEELFYGFSLERHVPADHLLRPIDRFVDLSGIRRHLAPYYSPIGRPSIDPELLIRMLIVGYCFGIRSERRLCEEVPQYSLPRSVSTRSNLVSWLSKKGKTRSLSRSAAVIGVLRS
jgi:transposase